MENIKPAFAKNNISICFSANDKYAPLLATTIASIAKCSSPNNNYDIIVLISDMNDDNQRKILSMVDNISNFSIRFVNVLPYVFGYKFYTESDISNTKYTDEIYFRLLAPAILKNFSKTLFLDADLVVRSDVAELFNTDISNNLIAAVRDYEGLANCYGSNYERTKYRINELGIKNFNDYFVSGVALMNIDEFNKAFSLKTLLDLAVEKNWKQYDQDLLNFLCNGRVKILNADWDYVEDIYNLYGSLPPELFIEYIESEKNPKIVHFSANRKPWIKIDGKYNADFWSSAELTPYYGQLKSMIENENIYH